MRIRTVLFCAALLSASVPAWAADLPGSEDHRLISRFPGSEITWYARKSFEPYKIAIGPVTDHRTISEWLPVEGKLTRINYTLKGERGVYEVYANYLNAVKQAGFEILAEGFEKTSSPKGAIGQRGFLGAHYAANPFPAGKSLLLHGSPTPGGSGYFAARLQRVDGDLYVVVGTVLYKQGEIITLVDIIEQRPMEQGLVQVDAKAMSSDIDRYGKVALYGLFFDHDKATLKVDSRPALEEIAKLLKQRGELRVYVVGHTDLSGDLSYNLKLSKARAQTVVDTLGKDYGIAAQRLEAQGVGPLVPVANNQADAGRARNRRVELVER